jgi:hypothetical protein
MAFAASGGFGLPLRWTRPYGFCFPLADRREGTLTKVERLPLNSATLEAIASVARLKVPAERHETLTSAAQGVFKLLGSFDRITLGETPPANTYSAKWDE